MESQRGCALTKLEKKVFLEVQVSPLVVLCLTRMGPKRALVTKNKPLPLHACVLILVLSFFVFLFCFRWLRLKLRNLHRQKEI